MLYLPLSEAIVFVLIAVVHAVAGVDATLQLLRKRARGRVVVVSCILGAVLLEVLLLVLRGISVRAVPLTGPFDSLILLTLVFGVSYLLLGRILNQVWFALVMVWLMFGTAVAAGLVARPVSRAEALAATPWAIAHASVMILAAASILLATAASSLYLLGSHGLKRKKVVRVLGRIPNMETLGTMNRVGLRLGFVLLTVGLASGLRLASLLGTGLAAWLSDGKVVCILAAWVLLAAILVWDRFFVLQVRVRAYVTIAAFGLILLATVGVTIVGATQHKFSSCCPPISGILAT